LTFVDPLVPLLILMGRTKHALLVATVIMLTDVAVNTHHAYNHQDPVYFGNLDLAAQTAFLAFVLCTAPLLWNYSDNQRMHDERRNQVA
jgi:hypothetical protein